MVRMIREARALRATRRDVNRPSGVRFGDLGCASEEDFVEQRQPVDPALEPPRIVETVVDHADCDGGHCAGVLERPEGIRGVRR